MPGTDAANRPETADRSPDVPGPRMVTPGCLPLHEGAENGKVARVGGGIIAIRGAADVGKVRLVHELGRGDAAPAERVAASRRLACSGVQTPCESRVPALMANDVTIGASTAREKSTTSCH